MPHSGYRNIHELTAAERRRDREIDAMVDEVIHFNREFTEKLAELRKLAQGFSDAGEEAYATDETWEDVVELLDSILPKTSEAERDKRLYDWAAEKVDASE